MAIILTGDGGWADLDKGLAEGLSVAGIPVVPLVPMSRRFSSTACRTRSRPISPAWRCSGHHFSSEYGRLVELIVR